MVESRAGPGGDPPRTRRVRVSHDVDLKKGTIRIRRALSQTKAGFILKDPKTKSSMRTIVLSPFAVDALRELKAAASDADLSTAPVFCTRTGGYLDKKNVLRAFRGVVKRANKSDAKNRRPLPERLRFHDLRHTVASLLLSAGFSLLAVSKRLGHSKPLVTLDIYGHVMPDDDAKLAAVVSVE